jgi:hypothetical protein
MEDINYTPSHNFRAMFNDAKAIKNIDRMTEIFDSLCSEVGIEDPVKQATGEALGKMAAAIRNHTNDTGVTAKKL